MSRMTRLGSGLTVVSDDMAHVDSVAVGVWVETGVRAEGEEEHGLAHFMEHMAFKGTERRSARDISEAIESVGGDINAATSVELTHYDCRMLAEDLPLALDILADILTAPRFDPEDVAREAGVIAQEIGAAEDDFEDRAFDAFPETAFPGQPFGRRILGTRETVASVTPDALRAFFGRHYVAPAMTVSAAGKVDHDALVDAVARAFEKVPTRPAASHEPPRYGGGRADDTARNASEVQVLVGFEGRAATHEDAVAAHLAGMVLGGGSSSRLFQALREENGYVYDTSAFHWGFRDAGLLGLHLATEPDKVVPALSLAIDELEKAAASMTEEEVRRAKAVWRAGILMSRESPSARAEIAARSAILFGRLRTKEERIAEMEAAGVDDVRRVLGEIIGSAPTVVNVGGAKPRRLDPLVERLRGLGTARADAA